jgi:SAM-dependent methyltransferase
MIAETSTGGGLAKLRSLGGSHRSTLAARTAPLRRRVHEAARRLRGQPTGRSSPPALASDRYDSWLQTFWGDELQRIDAACVGAGPEALALFRGLDADLWALLLTREYDLYPGIKALLPELPDVALQATWNGASGSALASQSLAFYEKLRHLYASHSALPLERSRVLDFGCGWGRLTRFLARDVTPGALFGCDPVQPILDLARTSRVPAQLARSAFVPDRLPFEQRFDLAYAFSVFTHLSETAHGASLRALHAAIAPDGLLMLTIRPPEYLRVCELLHPALASLGRQPETRLKESRYLFAAHGGQPLGSQAPDGQVTYGETVITPAYIRERWTDLFELLECDPLLGDPHQVVVVLRRRDQDSPGG